MRFNSSNEVMRRRGTPTLSLRDRLLSPQPAFMDRWHHSRIFTSGLGGGTNWPIALPKRAVIVPTFSVYKARGHILYIILVDAAIEGVNVQIANVISIIAAGRCGGMG